VSEIQELDIVIDKQGRVSIDVRGVAGPTCEEVTRALEEALAGKILAHTRKDEWHRQSSNTDDGLGLRNRS